MGKKGETETRKRGQTIEEWNRDFNRYIRKVRKIAQKRMKAEVKEKLRRLRQKHAHPGAQNLSIPRKSLIKPTGKPSVGKKRMQKAVEDSRS